MCAPEDLDANERLAGSDGGTRNGALRGRGAGVRGVLRAAAGPADGRAGRDRPPHGPLARGNADDALGPVRVLRPSRRVQLDPADPVHDRHARRHRGRCLPELREHGHRAAARPAELPVHPVPGTSLRWRRQRVVLRRRGCRGRDGARDAGGRSVRRLDHPGVGPDGDHELASRQRVHGSRRAPAGHRVLHDVQHGLRRASPAAADRRHLPAHAARAGVHGRLRPDAAAADDRRGRRRPRGPRAHGVRELAHRGGELPQRRALGQRPHLGLDRRPQRAPGLPRSLQRPQRDQRTPALALRGGDALRRRELEHRPQRWRSFRRRRRYGPDGPHGRRAGHHLDALEPPVHHAPARRPARGDAGSRPHVAVERSGRARAALPLRSSAPRSAAAGVPDVRRCRQPSVPRRRVGRRCRRPGLRRCERHAVRRRSDEPAVHGGLQCDVRSPGAVGWRGSLLGLGALALAARRRRRG